MSHEINFNENTGKHSFFSVKETPWHGLGQVIEDYPTSKEALQFAGLDYKVEKRASSLTITKTRRQMKKPALRFPNWKCLITTLPYV